MAASNYLKWAEQHKSLLNYAESRYFFVEYLKVEEGEFTHSISNEHLEELSVLVGRLRADEPFAYVVGNAPFLGRNFQVNSSVLIPRPETEELVEQAVAYLKKPTKILECCTGSGVIAISLQKHFSNCQVVANDISGKALAVAKKNAQLYEANVVFSQQDVLSSSFWNDLPVENFDLIISNPPYISSLDYQKLEKCVLSFEPKVALQAEEDGLVFYRVFAEQARKKLSSNGVFMAEIGHEQGADILKKFKDNGWEARVKKDMFGKDRFLVAKNIR